MPPTASRARSGANPTLAAPVRAAEKEYDPAKLEARIREMWELTDAYDRVRRSRENGEPWYFIDGPPYATGGIHLGTARNKTLKDLFVRYHRMKGMAVRDQAGFDMHGLPIEVKVEQELGFRSKKDIEGYGIDKFVQRCREFGLRYKDIMTGEFQELGVWLDWENPYLTIANEYLEGAWWALGKAHERGLLYESERVLTWCWRCETALAAAEVEYENRRDPSVYVRFPLVDRPGEFLVVWTTTPWTLPANVAVAAHPDLEYARVLLRHSNGETETVIVAASLAESVARAARASDFAIVERVGGRSLEGLRYRAPFETEVPFHREGDRGRRYTVLLSTHVESDRTGLVHTATGHGVEDFEVGARYGIPPFCPVGEDGTYTPAAGSFAGLAVKSKAELSPADERVLALLAEKKLLLAQGLDAHSYGHCWRCKNPIIYRATRQWFIDIGKIKTEMIAEVDRVRWTPEWAGSARERDWVVNARDWCISRQRYWGIPVPVWRCSNAHIRVVGSAAELEHDGLNYEAGMDLHRPWIDGVVMPCKQCGGDMRRVPDVLDVWFDSAVASWAELRFPSHSRDFEKWFPCDFIVEGLDQTRGWFYSQLAAGVAAMGRVPYESVVMHGWVNDEQGRPMSKSLGNYIPPHELIVKHGADAVRFELLRAGAPWDDLSIGWEAIRNRSRVLNVLWNVHVFATTYMALDAFVPPSGAAASRPRAATSLRVEDRWMRSRVASVIARATAALESHEVQVAAREVERLILEDLSRWYVRLVRDRVWSEGHQADKVAAYETLHHALLSLAKLLAPMAPYLAEALFQDLVPTGATVHGERWPEAQAADLDVELEESMATVRAIVEASANARQNAGMKLRWPVARVVVAGGKDVERAIEGNRGLLEEMTNAKRIDFVGEAWAGLEVVAQPVKNRIGPAFKGRAGEAIAALQRADGRAVRKAIQSGGWEAAPGIVLGADMVTFETRLPPHVTGSEFQGGAIYIDTDVTPELKGEGYARDLSRRIQELRKRLALPLEQRIAVDVLAPPDFQALVAPHAGNVAQATRATAVQFVQEPAGAVVETWDIEGEAITIGVRPLGGEFPAARGPAQASTNRAPGRSRKVAVKRAPRPRGATTPRKTARTRAARARGKTTTGRNRPIRSQTGGVSPSRAGKAEGKRARTGRPRGRKGRSSGASKPASRAAGRPPRKGQAKGPPRSKKGRGRSR